MANERKMFAFLKGLGVGGAPQHERIRLLADEYGLPILEAREVVKKFDATHILVYRIRFGGNKR